MVKAAEPWQTAEIAGPKKAILIKNEAVVKRIRKANRPILVVGHQATNDYAYSNKMIDYAIQMSQKANIPIVATAHMAKEFIKRDFQPASFLSAMDIGNRLSDQEWKGLDGKGKYDLALFMGIPYYMEFVILAGLKHFTSLETITLDRYYHPHARRSLPNLSINDWAEGFETMISLLGVK